MTRPKTEPDFTQPLVTTDWLGEKLDDPDTRLIDGSWYLPGSGKDALQLFQQRRIPGAVYFDIDAIADTASRLPHMAPSPSIFAHAIGELGISPSSKVIVYDNAGLFSAARVWWTFKLMGHGQVAVLNGGMPKWQSEGRPVDSAAPHPPEPVAYEVPAAFHASMIVSSDDVLRALQTKDVPIVDARPAARFEGLAPEPRPALRSGAMPGALNLPHSLLLTDSSEMKSPAELAAIFDNLGIDQNQPIIASCGSGVTAAVILLARASLRASSLPSLGGRPSLGISGDALYDGSWSEWGAEENATRFPVIKKS